MEKTKFELDCERCCSECIKQSMDICNLPGHCKDEVEMSRCGVCGEIYCSEEAMTENNICASCGSLISRNIDADNEIVDNYLFTRKESVLKRILQARVVLFPDGSFFNVKDVAIGIAAIVLFTLIIC